MKRDRSPPRRERGGGRVVERRQKRQSRPTMRDMKQFYTESVWSRRTTPDGRPRHLLEVDPAQEEHKFMFLKDQHNGQPWCLGCACAGHTLASCKNLKTREQPPVRADGRGRGRERGGGSERGRKGDEEDEEDEEDDEDDEEEDEGDEGDEEDDEQEQDHLADGEKEQLEQELKAIEEEQQRLRRGQQELAKDS